MHRITARAALISTLLSLAGCASVDRLYMTEFEPTGANEFRYKAFANAAYKPEDPESEATRIEWLQQYLTDNNLCPNGYVIDDRKSVYNGTILAAKTYDLIYYGHCTN